MSLPLVVCSKTLPVAVVLCSPRVHCRKCSFTKEWPKVRHLCGNKGIFYIYQRLVQTHEFSLNDIWCVSNKAELPNTSKTVIILPGFNFCNHSQNNNDGLGFLLKASNVTFVHLKNKILHFCRFSPLS